MCFDSEHEAAYDRCGPKHLNISQDIACPGHNRGATDSCGHSPNSRE